MRLLHKVLIGGTIVAVLILVVFLTEPSSQVITIIVVLVSIIVTFLGLAYYEGKQEGEAIRTEKRVQQDLL